MDIKVPKRKWFTYATIYKTLVRCPRCGNTRYADLTVFGKEYCKVNKWVKNKDWTQIHCDLCDELMIVYMINNEDDLEIQSGVWYDVESPETSLDNAKKIIITRKNNLCEITAHLDDGWNRVIAYNVDWETCLDILFNNYKVLGKSEKQDYPLPEIEDD